MQFNYNLSRLTNRFDNAEPLKYLFFWGHTGKEVVGKHCFSQWFDLPFMVDGVVYRTAERWMMAQKALLFSDFEIFQKIIDSEKPGEAKDLGRRVKNFDEQLWDEEKYRIVVRGNFHKFGQHPQFKEYLLQTGDRVLVEASPVDRIWGIGLAQDADNLDNPHFWNGQNLLGFALMEVRDLLDAVGNVDSLNNIPPLPWEAYPATDPHDQFWRMGAGEDLIIVVAKYYDGLSPQEKVFLTMTRPAPRAWAHFYDE